MSPELALVLVFLASAGFAFGLMALWRLRRRRRGVVRSLQRKGSAGGPPSLSSSGKPGRLAKIGRVLAGKRSGDSKLRLRLTRAGWDTRTAPLTYSAIRLWLLVSLPLLAAAVAYTAHSTRQEIILFALAGLVVALMVPRYVLERRTRLRQRRISKSLPDALDLMVVCVEAGVGVDAAILRVSDELGSMHPDLAHEFQVVNQRVNAGIARIDALREMVARTAVDDLRTIVITLIQSEKLGVSIGRVLRVSGDALRTKRKQAAEQEARKASIKMLVPLVVFILPALFLVIIGPAGIQVVEVLRNIVR